MFNAGQIPLARLLIEVEQALFENEFLEEATVRELQNEIEKVYRQIERTPQDAHLDISSWKNKWVRTLMIDIMRFKDASFTRYLNREMQMVNARKAEISTQHGRVIVLNLEAPTPNTST